MSDSTSEREKRLRALMSSKQKASLGVVSQGQAEILGMQNDLQNTVAQQQLRDQSQAQTNNMMQQMAVNAMAEDAGRQQAVQTTGRQVGNMNTYTQNVMKKYGVKPENTRKTQTSTIKQVSGVNTTNVRNETTTNNHTEIRITQPQIPIAQPQIAISQPQRQSSGNIEKFKAWMSNMFAKQQNEAEIQRKEYRKKEWAIGRNTTKLMKKISDATNNLSDKLNPEYRNQSITGQLKWLFLLFGATILGKIWKPLMMWLENFEGGFRMVFGLPVNEKLRGNSDKAYSLISKIQTFLGVSKDKSLLAGFGEVIMDGVDRLISHVKLFFKDRGMAIREVSFPEIPAPDFGLFQGVLGPAMEGITNTFRGIGQYLGDLITVALGGSKGRVKVEARKIQRQAMNTFTNTDGKITSAGENSLAQGRGGRDYLRNNDFNLAGDLKANAGSTHAMSRTLMSLLNDKSNKSHAAEITSGIEQLFKVADRSGQVTIDPGFLASLGITQRDILQLKSSGQLKEVPYKMIKVRPENADLAEEGKLSTGWEKAGGVIGSAADLAIPFGGIAKGAAKAGYKGLIHGQNALIASGKHVKRNVNKSIAKKGLFYGLMNPLETVGEWTGGWVDERINSSRRNDTSNYVYKIVPIDSNETSEDGSAPVVKPMLTLTRQGAEYVTSVLAGKGGEASLTNENFYKKIKSLEKGYKLRNGVRGDLKDNLNVNELRARQHQAAEYDAQVKEIWGHEGPWRTTVDNISKTWDEVRSGLAGELRNLDTRIISGGGRKRVSDSEYKARINHCMKFFMDKGLTQAQAAGIVGNLMTEGLFLKDLGEEHEDVNGPSAGIAQFHDIRGQRGQLSMLKEFAAKHGLNWRDLDTQLEFLWNGSDSRNAIMNIKKQTTGMSDEEATAKSAHLWGHLYERFRGHENEGHKSYRDRRNNAARAIRNFDPSNVSVSKFEAAPIFDEKLLSSNKGETNNNTFQIGWLGDSHSTSLLVPEVSKKIDKPIGYYGHVGTIPKHYIADIQNKFTKPEHHRTNLGVNSCRDALNKILELKPVYVILEFGHNGIDGFSKLTLQLQEAGIKVIGIIMWPVKNSDAKSIISLYDGCTPNGWINLAYLFGSDTKYYADNVHLTREGYRIVATEIADQLKGKSVGTETVEDLTGTSKVQDIASDALNTIADWLDPKKSGTSSGIPAWDSLSEEDKKRRQELSERIIQEQAFNKKSWLELGAQEDATGSVYFKSGNARVYLRTDAGHNGMFGVNGSDVDFVTADDPSKSLTYEEAEQAESAVIRDIRAYFMENPKGNGSRSKDYNDYLKDPSKGSMTLFDICKLPSIYPEQNKDRKKNDISIIKDMKMDKFAKKDFKDGIHLYVSPNNALTGYTVVSIMYKVRSATPIFGDVEYFDDLCYGPEIYHKGSTKWHQIGTTPEQQIFSDYQPLCQLRHVKLENSADAKFRVSKLLSLLALTSRVSVQGSDLTFKDTGEKVDNETKKALESLGLTTYGARGNLKWTGLGDSVQRSYRDGQQALSDAGYEKLYETFGKTKEEREKYYSKNKKDFTEIGGKIYHKASGLEIGTTDKGIYDNNELEKVLGKDPENIKKTLQDNVEKIADSVGFDSQLGSVNADSLGKFMQKVLKTDTKGNTKTNKYNSGVSGVRSYLDLAIGPKRARIPIEVKYLPDGTTEYSVTDSAIAIALGGQLAGKNTKHLTFSKKDLTDKIINVIKSGKTVTNWDGKYNLQKSITADSTDDSKEILDIIKQGVKISHVDFPDGAYFQSGYQSKVTFEDGHVAHYKIDQKVLKGRAAEINRQIEQRIKAKRDEAADEAFEGSGLQQQFKAAFDDVKANGNNYSYENGFVRSKQTGMIVATYDPKKDPEHKNIKAITTGTQATNVGIDFLDSNTELRRKFNQNLLGLSKDDTIVVNGKRIKINTGRLISNTYKNDSLQGFLGDARVVGKDGKLASIEDEKTKKALKDFLNNKMKDIKKSGGLEKVLRDQLKDATDIQKQQLDHAKQVELKEAVARVNISTIDRNVQRLAVKLAGGADNAQAALLEEQISSEKGISRDKLVTVTGLNGDKQMRTFDKTKVKDRSEVDKNNDGKMDDKTASKDERWGGSWNIYKEGDRYYYAPNGNLSKAVEITVVDG